MLRFSCLLLVILVQVSLGARVKDVATLDGLSDRQLVGYGLVLGLAGTGDGASTQFTVQSVANMLQKMGIEVPTDRMRLRNVAAVMVTADLPAFLKPGQRMDVTLSSIGDARSLEGGTLLLTPLQSEEGEVYAMAQGPVAVGGLQIADAGGKSRYSKNHSLSGSIPNGAVVKKETESASLGNELRWVLRQPDFSSAAAMAEAINKVSPGAAKAQDAGTVLVKVPSGSQNDLAAFIAKSENAEFEVGVNARVVINERTGTLVSGAAVSISEVAVAHGNIVIQVDAKKEISQPNALSQGRTASIIQEQVKVTEDTTEVKVIPSVSNVGELAKALNALGVAPRDIIAIFQAIKKAGALQAELVVM